MSGAPSSGTVSLQETDTTTGNGLNRKWTEVPLVAKPMAVTEGAGLRTVDSHKGCGFITGVHGTGGGASTSLVGRG